MSNDHLTFVRPALTISTTRSRCNKNPDGWFNYTFQQFIGSEDGNGFLITRMFLLIIIIARNNNRNDALSIYDVLRLIVIPLPRLIKI